MFGSKRPHISEPMDKEEELNQSMMDCTDAQKLCMILSLVQILMNSLKRSSISELVRYGRLDPTKSGVAQ